MFERSKNTGGFTLAELLLSIAIIVVLAALAIPSISLVQKNMRMLELDSAASDIASAAQQQMTTMKTGGTWTALIEKHSELIAESAQAQGVPVNIQESRSHETDLYFMTADQARTLGILPESSIDDDVRNGDYVIEYSVSTATIFGVFYTDGKAGFFQEAADVSLEKPVEEYYIRGSLADSEKKRDQENRLKADPLIGYFGGTPAGTTRTVALTNPVIWVNDEGKLCIQDPNLSKHSDWNTMLEVFIENKKTGTTATLAFSSLQGKAFDTIFTIGTDLEAGNQKLFDNKGLTKFYSVDYRDALDMTANIPDTYTFELDMMKNSSDAYLNNLVKDFTYGDPIKVTATVKTNQKPCVPATATATIEWPKPVSMVRVLVTNPDAATESERASYITGAYAAPDAYVVDSAGKKSETIKGLSITENYILANTNAALTAQNGEAKNQRYTGIRVARSSLISAQGALLASIGSYKSSKTQSLHQYQIQEIWVGIGSNSETSIKQRIGYLSDNKWTWANGAGTVFSTCFNAAQLSAGMNTVGITSLTVSPDKAEEALRALGYEGTESIAFYIRTAPSIDDARVFFTGQTSTLGHEQIGGELPDIIAALKQDGVTVSARNATNETAKNVRQRFETEFGCSSSGSVWSLTNEEDSGQTDMNNEPFPDNDNKDIRLYYAITPAFGFGASSQSGANNLDYAASNTALWYYSERTATVYAQAMVHDARDAVEKSSYYWLVTPQGGTSDFEFRTNQDYLFYRVLKFYETYDPTNSAFNKATGLPIQYVPYSVQSNTACTEAVLPTLPDKVDPYGTVLSRFLGWKATETYPSGSASSLMTAGSLVGTYQDNLAFVGTNLVAQYKTEEDKGTGLVYLEYSDEAKTQVSGWYGYLGSEQEQAANRLTDSNTIAAWQYGLLTAVGAKEPKNLTGTGFFETNLMKVEQPVVIEGVEYTLWLINTNESAMRSETRTFTYAGSKGTVTYSFNLNFAAAVAKDGAISSAWGAEIPWQVRHSDQFLGSVVPGHKNQAIYLTQNFTQTHDIDMSTVKDSYKIGQDNAFTGTYDGQNHEIRGFERANYFISYKDGERKTQGFSVKSPTLGYGQGLFPYVKGDGSSDVVLSNIKLVASGSDLSSYGTDSNANFGWLAGLVESGKVENCSLIGYDQDGTVVSYGNEVQLTLRNASTGTNVAGILIGKTSQTIVENVAVEGISATYICRTSEWGSPLILGGIIGTVEDGSVTSSSIKNIGISLSDTNMLRFNTLAYFGGIAGRAEQSTIQKCTLETTALSLPGFIAINGGSAAYGIIAGSIAGSTVSDNTITDLAVSIPHAAVFNTGNGSLVFGGFVGALSVVNGDNASYVQNNLIARTTLSLANNQDVRTMTFGWGAGWLGFGTVDSNTGNDAALFYRIGEGEYQEVVNEVGR